jgi:hypothetical protein
LHVKLPVAARAATARGLHDDRVTEYTMRKLILVTCVASMTVVGCQRQPSGSPVQAATTAAAGTRAEGGDPAASPAGSNAARAPAWREVTIPEGTRLSIRLEGMLASDSSRVEEPVQATVIARVVVRGVTVVPAGSAVGGVVTEARRAGRVEGRAEVAVRFDTLHVMGDDQQYAIQTGLVTRRAPTTHRKDALEIGVPAIGGAVVGGLLGGRKGAIVGGTVGGGAGTAVVLSTRGREIRLPRGTHLAVKLLAPVTVRVPA